MAAVKTIPIIVPLLDIEYSALYLINSSANNINNIHTIGRINQNIASIFCI